MAFATSAPTVSWTPFDAPVPGTAPVQTVGLVQQFVESTGSLYSLPAAAAEVLRLTGAPTIDLAAIKHCVESDPALAARILRVTNSSLFGPSRQVTDLSQALTLLGIRPLKILVLGFSLPRELFTGLQAEVLSWYWRHTLIKAVAARELAERVWHLPGDEPFLAGLVQDIGILALIQQLGEPYQKLLSQLQTHGGSLVESELEVLGFDHLVLSARLLAHWGLPPGLCAAVSVPPTMKRIKALSPEERTLPQMLHLSELLARLIEQPYGSALHELLQAGASYCGLTYEALQPLVVALQNKVQDLADVLSLKLPGGRSYVDLLLDAHTRLADEALVSAAIATERAAGTGIPELQSELNAAVQRSVSRKPDRTLPGRPINASRSERAMPGAGGNTAHRCGLTTTSRITTAADLHARLSAALEAARQRRTPLTLVFFEIDRFGDLLMQLGVGGSAEAMHLLCDAVGRWSATGDRALQVSDSRVAVIASECSRHESVEMARSVLAEVKPWSSQHLPLSFELTLSSGLATLEVPLRNYTASDFLPAAERCLSAAQLSGGNTVKSIDL